MQFVRSMRLLVLAFFLYVTRAQTVASYGNTTATRYGNTTSPSTTGPPSVKSLTTTFDLARATKYWDYLYGGIADPSLRVFCESQINENALIYDQTATVPTTQTRRFTIKEGPCSATDTYDCPTRTSGVPLVTTTETERYTFTKAFTPIAKPPCCSVCSIWAHDVQLRYWPSPAPTPAVTQVVEKGFTYVSPSVYMVMANVSAYDLCGPVGRVYDRVTLSFAPDELSTYVGNNAAAGLSVTARPLNYAQLQANCSTTWVQAGTSIYRVEGTSTRYFSSEIGDQCLPYLVAPSQVLDIDPAFAQCTGKISGFYDPPFALKPGDSLTDGVTPTPSAPQPVLSPLPATPTPKQTPPPSTKVWNLTPIQPPNPPPSNRPADPPASPVDPRVSPQPPAGDPPPASPVEPKASPKPPAGNSPAASPPATPASSENRPISPPSVFDPAPGSASPTPVKADPPAQNSPPSVPYTPPTQNSPAVQNTPPAQNNPPMQNDPPAQNSPPAQAQPSAQNTPTGQNNPPAQNDPPARNSPPAQNNPPPQANPSGQNNPPVQGNPPSQNDPSPTNTALAQPARPVIVVAGSSITDGAAPIAIGGTTTTNTHGATTIIGGITVALTSAVLHVGTVTTPLASIATTAPQQPASPNQATSNSPVVVGGLTISAVPPRPTIGAPVVVGGAVVSVDPSGSGVVIGSRTILPGSVATVSGIAVSLGPAGLVVGPDAATGGGGGAAAATTIALPKVVTPAPAVVTVGGETVTALADGFAIAGTTLKQGGGAVTVGGTPVSLGPTGLLVVGTSTIHLPVLPTGGPTTAPNVITVGGDLITALPSGFAIAGTTLKPGGGAVTVAGTPVSLGPSGLLVIGTSTINLPVPTPSIITVGGETITALPSGFAIAGTTIRQGGGAITVAGTPVSLGPSGLLVIGTSTITLPVVSTDGTTTSSVGLGGVILSAFGPIVPSATRATGGNGSSITPFLGTGQRFGIVDATILYITITVGLVLGAWVV